MGPRGHRLVAVCMYQNMHTVPSSEFSLYSAAGRAGRSYSSACPGAVCSMPVIASRSMPCSSFPMIIAVIAGHAGHAALRMRVSSTMFDHWEPHAPML